MPDPEPNLPIVRHKRKLSLRKKLLFSLVATLSFFAVVELSLTLAGVSSEIDTVDPFVGFDHHVPLMQVGVNESDEAIVSTAANKLVWFNQQSFPKNKPAGTKRIFCLGGSTTFGRPYRDLTSYSGWLREFLSLADETQHWEVINAGGVSYASYRVAAVMEELAKYEADVFIVYTAHNEFLERRTYAGMFEKPSLTLRARRALRRTRTWSAMQSVVNRVRQSPNGGAKETLAGEVNEMLNASIGPTEYHRDGAWRKKVLHHYESNLHRMVAIARSAGAEIMFITPASNEKDCSPFKSEPSEDLHVDDLDRFALAVKRAKRLQDAGDHNAALHQFQTALAVDDHQALLHYQIGRLFLQMGRQAEAREHFARSIDEDICPLRAVTEISESIRRVAHRDGVPLVDFEANLRATCVAELEHDCLGREYFLDHVHPTIDVHRQLALWIIVAMQRDELADLRSLTAAEIDRVDRHIRRNIDANELGVALRNLAKVLHWAGKFDEAAPRATDALQLIQDDPESRFVLADCLINLGQRDKGFEQYEKIFATGDFPRAYLPYGEMLAQRGRLEDAKYYLTLAAVFGKSAQRRARALCFLGSTQLQLQEFKLAEESLFESNKLYGDDPYTLLKLAEANQGLGKTQKAIQWYEVAIRIDPDYTEAHHRLGLLYLKTERFAEAIARFQSVLADNPASETATQNIAIAEAMKSSHNDGDEPRDSTKRSH